MNRRWIVAVGATAGLVVAASAASCGPNGGSAPASAVSADAAVADDATIPTGGAPDAAIPEAGDAAPPGAPDAADAAPLDAGPPCNVVDVNGNGPDDDDVQALLCAGADAVLCRSTVYAVDGIDALDAAACGAGLHFVAPGQKIYTEGYPTGSQRAVLRLADATTATVLQGNGIDGVSLAYVEIDGSRPTLSWLEGGDALVSLTGIGVTVSYSFLHDPRGWSTLHLTEGANLRCSGAVIHDNVLGPAGCDKQGHGCTASDPLYATSGKGSWADGLSLSCKNAVVYANTINDATDGAIVMFGAPGSHVYGNHVNATSRHLFGGVNMVDPGPYSFDAGTYGGGDYTGDEVDQNDIHASGARIDVGIAQGPLVWSSWCGQALFNRGANVHDNTVDGLDFGYGFVVDGVAGWTAQNNTSTATHSDGGSGCGAPIPAAAAALYHPGHVIQSTVEGSGEDGGIHNVLQ